MNDPIELERGGFLYSTDKSKLDVDYVHHFLSSRSYWSPDVPREIVAKSIENSLAIGIYKDNRQVGFARVVTDYATFGYLADVFVDESFRGVGLSKKLMDFILSFDFVPGLRRFLLATKDAHGLYEQFSFKALQKPDRFMEIHQPDVYSRKINMINND